MFETYLAWWVSGPTKSHVDISDVVKALHVYITHLITHTQVKFFKHTLSQN